MKRLKVENVVRGLRYHVCNLDNTYQDLLFILDKGLVKKEKLQPVLDMIDDLQNAIEELEID